MKNKENCFTYQKGFKDAIKQVLAIIERCADHHGIINKDELKQEVEDLK